MSSDYRLPSLKALQVLECVARTRSFKDAASELFVTPAAVSFQIRQLEKDLNTQLFERTSSGVILTEASEAFMPKLTVGLEAIHEAFKTFLSISDDITQPIRVTSGPAVMSKWLVPEMHTLRKQNPNIEIEFSAGVGMMDLLRDNIDFAIRFGTRPDSHIKQEIAEEYLLPVVSPSLAHQVRCPEDLLKCCLIHDLLVPFGPAIPTGLYYYLLSQTEEPQTSQSKEVLQWLVDDICNKYEELIRMAQSLCEVKVDKRICEGFRALDSR